MFVVAFCVAAESIKTDTRSWPMAGHLTAARILKMRKERARREYRSREKK